MSPRSTAVDWVGFEAKGQAEQAGTEQPATVLNSLVALTRAGGAIGIPGLYVTDDPGAKDVRNTACWALGSDLAGQTPTPSVRGNALFFDTTVS